MLDGTQFSDPEIKNTIRTGNFHLYIYIISSYMKRELDSSEA